MPNERQLKARTCRACGRGGALAAYAGRGYFHFRCAGRWMKSGRMFREPEERGMTVEEECPACDTKGTQWTSKGEF